MRQQNQIQSATRSATQSATRSATRAKTRATKQSARQATTQAALALRLGHEFADPFLLHQAVQHASFDKVINNEKLEFLGDRVLGLVLADILLATYPDEAEGALSKRLAFLVSRAQCAQIAAHYNMGAALIMKKKNKHLPFNENILGNLCEAIIAAIYKDGGLEAAHRFIITAWAPLLADMDEVPENPKSALQEYVLAEGWELPKYEIVSLKGPDHAPQITVELSLSNGATVTAQGATRKKAEYAAASKMLAQFNQTINKT
ncbi:MAG: ribonuclease III [Alphaproteobacteria bacterium]|nr:ribonuclease III [Alphaproteobacteria bacterium]